MSPIALAERLDFEDDFDLLSSSASTLVAPTSSSRDVTVAPELDQRVLRERKKKDTSLVIRIGKSGANKRKRTLTQNARDTAATEQDGKKAKKAKVDNKKLVCSPGFFKRRAYGSSEYYCHQH
jgi:hypothetical protein